MKDKSRKYSRKKKPKKETKKIYARNEYKISHNVKEKQQPRHLKKITILSRIISPVAQKN